MQLRLEPDQEHMLVAQAPHSSEAFRQLYQHYFPRVYAYVAARTDRAQDAEDLVATAFLRVVEELGRFEYRGAGSFAAWLFRIVHNLLSDFQRRGRRQPALPLDDVPAIPHQRPQLDDLVIERESAALLRRLIQTLSPRRQEVIMLKFFAQLRNQEIALILGLDERTVAAHLSRALADLQRRYREEQRLMQGETL